MRGQLQPTTAQQQGRAAGESKALGTQRRHLTQSEVPTELGRLCEKESVLGAVDGFGEDIPERRKRPSKVKDMKELVVFINY